MREEGPVANGEVEIFRYSPLPIHPPHIGR